MMKKMFVLCLLSLIGAVGVMAQEKTVQISLPKYCCSESDQIIEKVLAYEKGVESFQINPVTKSVIVTFKEKKTSQEKIEKALAKSGFETPNFEANKRMIEKLPTCCKNTAKGLESNCFGTKLIAPKGVIRPVYPLPCQSRLGTKSNAF